MDTWFGLGYTVSSICIPNKLRLIKILIHLNMNYSVHLTCGLNELSSQVNGATHITIAILNIIFYSFIDVFRYLL